MFIKMFQILPVILNIKYIVSKSEISYLDNTNLNSGLDQLPV